MPRNFGLSFEKLSSRPASSGVERLQTGPHYSAERADTNVFRFPSAVPLPPGGSWPDSLAKDREPFIHPFEIGSSVLFLGLALLPIAIVGGIVIGYLAFVA